MVAWLRAEGLYPLEVTAEAGIPIRGAGQTRSGGAAGSGPRVGTGTGSIGWWQRPVSRRRLAVFTRQLATLLKAGMPLVRGLEVLVRQERQPAMRRMIEGLADGIRSGGSLSAALTGRPRLFDRLYVNMVAAGEAGGALDAVLARLADHQEKSLRLQAKLRAAMLYPLVVMTVAVLVLAGLLVHVVPRFEQIFADLLKGAPLPPLTQFVMIVSEVARTHYALVLVGTAACWVLLGWVRRTRSGARIIDRTIVQVPVIGDLVLKSTVARLARTMGTLLASGVPILEALQITRDATCNAHIAAAIQEAHDRVREGAPLARPLAAAGVFPAMVTSLVEVGEHTGQLAGMLVKIAEIYDDEVDASVAGLSSLLEPVLIVLLAGVVGTIVVALFLPIVRIVQLLT